ncbi:helix-turn-helix domain-containing protein [Kribbella sp. NPDC050820]|uniref:helix-turn-helix domain-containing protein n=1 Tax=Kribbella sp. NPDC050820 TaxID=3155408 RepID=UPI0033DE04A7
MTLTVQQAARMLKISEQEVRRLVSVGELAAERVGERVLAVDENSVRQRASHRPSRGRPWTPAKAWAALWHLSGLEVDWLTAIETWRLRAKLELINADQLAIAARKRAQVETGRILPDYLHRLTETKGVVRTGVSAAADAGADLVTTGELVDVYCGPALRPELIARYGISLTTQNPNVVLRTPEGGLQLLDGRDAMPAAVVAADLLDATEPRTARAGRDLLDQLLKATR